MYHQRIASIRVATKTQINQGSSSSINKYKEINMYIYMYIHTYTYIHTYMYTGTVFIFDSKGSRPSWGNEPRRSAGLQEGFEPLLEAHADEGLATSPLPNTIVTA